MGGKSSVIPGESQASLAWSLILCNRTGCEGHQEGQRSVNHTQRDWRGFGYKVAPAISWNPMGVSSENQKLGWGELRGERKKGRQLACQCARVRVCLVGRRDPPAQRASGAGRYCSQRQEEARKPSLISSPALPSLQ